MTTAQLRTANYSLNPSKKRHDLPEKKVQVTVAPATLSVPYIFRNLADRPQSIADSSRTVVLEKRSYCCTDLEGEPKSNYDHPWGKGKGQNFYSNTPSAIDLPSKWSTNTRKLYFFKEAHVHAVHTHIVMLL